MNMLRILPCLLLAWAGAAAAETVDCPDPATAVQVGTCPAEEELRYTFQGYCSDNARLYDRGDQVCTDYALYRKMKNVSLWETRDGRFSGYASCDPAAPALATAKLKQLSLARQGSLTRVVCDYDNGTALIHRTKSRCSVAATPCAGAACRASCE